MDLQKGTILVTGANGGLGSAIVSQIVSDTELGAYHGIFTVRDVETATVLRAILESAMPTSSSSNEHERISLDLSRLHNVRKVAAAINTNVETGIIPPISAIILNAGYEEGGNQTWTEDGLDTTFVVNYLGHWLLTLLLLRSINKERGRIIWISSWARNPEDKHNIMNGSFEDNRYKTMITDDLDSVAKGTWSPDVDGEPAWAAGYRRYGASKLCGVSMIHELQRRLDQDPILRNISVLAVDPGGMATGIVRHSNWFVRVIFFRIFVGMSAGLLLRIWPNGTWRTPQKSARDVLAAAFRSGPPPLSEQPKGLYLNGSELGEYNSEAKDPKKGRLIWEGSVRFADLKADETILQCWM